jgi:flagellar biosynthesis repressor protein FlbT
MMRPEGEYMPLKITLKPHERLILAGAAITNGSSTANLIIENKVPILRKKDILKEEDASSPARRIYFVIQLMYLDQENRAAYQNRYRDLVRDFVQAAPSAQPLINEINVLVTGDQYYAALKVARKVVRYEDMILSLGRSARK